jgi:hypothetical protein
MAARKARKKTPRGPVASDRVRHEWRRRIEAEYRSAAITQNLVLWLIQIAASPDLILDGLRIVKDELKHAELSHITYLAAGGDVPSPIVRETLALRRTTDPLEHDVLRTAVETFCLGETVAVRLFSKLRDKCEAPSARRALDRILRDEVRHRDFGWSLLEWLSETPYWPELQKRVEDELPKMFVRLRAAYAPAAGRNEEEISSADRAWGLMPTAHYARALERTLTDDYVPRFAKRGIDAKKAWNGNTVT